MEFQMQKNQKKDEAEEEKKRRMRLRGELPPEDEEPEEDWEPERIRSLIPFLNQKGEERFIVSSQGLFNGFIYVCSMDSERPLEAIEIKPNRLVSFMKEFKGSEGASDILLIGYDDATIELVVNLNFSKRMVIKNHDSSFGPVSSACFTHNYNFFLTSGEDGLVYLHQFDKHCCIQDYAFDPLAGVEGAQFMPNDEKEVLVKKKREEYTA
jgi:WD40 repeat protein